MGASELLELQRLDDRLVDLRRRDAELAERLRRSPELEAARAGFAESEETAWAADEAVEVADRRVAELRSRARVLERQLFGGSVRNPQELMTLDRELAEVKIHLSDEEEDELARMQAQEDAHAALATARAAVTEIEARRAAAAGPETEQLAGIRERIAETVTERELARTRRSAAELALYDRLAARLQPVVVRLGANDTCPGCRIAISPREARAVRVGEVMTQCPNCDRVLAR